MKCNFEIAKVLKPHGVRGDMKVEFFYSDPKRLSSLKNVSIAGVFYDVQKISSSGDYGIIRLKGIDSPESVEKLRGKSIVAKREDLPPLNDGEHYIEDLIGLNVIADGEKIGVIKEISKASRTDVYVVKTKGGTLSFPALKKIIEKTDVEGGEIVLNSAELKDNSVFNKE